MDVFLVVIGWVAGVALGLVALFWTIRGAVLSALRFHTLNSTTGVSIVNSVPLATHQVDTTVKV